MSACLKMKQIVMKILEARNQTEKFESGEYHLRITNEPYLPLVIERHDLKITVTHYFSLNGDLIADPDMEFVIGCDGNWYPVAIQFSDGTYRRARYSENGKEFISPKEADGQKRFSDIWAKNLRDQGYITVGR